MTAADRCDQCGARAYYRAHLSAGELTFCAHHGRQVLDKLRKVASAIEDHTDQLDYARAGRDGI
jgi:hypothetical protein